QLRKLRGTDMTDQEPKRVDVQVMELLPGLMNRVLRLIEWGGYSKPKTLSLANYTVRHLSLKTGSILATEAFIRSQGTGQMVQGALMDWEHTLSQHGVPYATRGPNVARGAIAVKCPFCGPADPSE